MQYSQGDEQITIQKYVGDSIGTCLSIGENSGFHLSNVLALIEAGWSATLIEPSPSAFKQLDKKHKENFNVQSMNVAVADFIGQSVMYDSGTHLKEGDTALLSTMSITDYEKWKSTTEFSTILVDVIDFEELLSRSIYKTFDVISIDAEGFDLIILKQMNLQDLGCKLLCIEHNGNLDVLDEIKQICNHYGLTKQLLINAENVIWAEGK
ncbi:MAG: FkbM family methyltransferase [Bacteroidia bacterium]